MLDAARTELRDARTELRDARTELSDARTELSDCRTELSDARTALHEAGHTAEQLRSGLVGYLVRHSVVYSPVLAVL